MSLTVSVFLLFVYIFCMFGMILASVLDLLYSVGISFGYVSYIFGTFDVYISLSLYTAMDSNGHLRMVRVGPRKA